MPDKSSKLFMKFFELSIISLNRYYRIVLKIINSLWYFTEKFIKGVQTFIIIAINKFTLNFHNTFSRKK